jgi:hypothetical protein
MIEKQASTDVNKPLYTIPIITTPQLHISSINKYSCKNEL